VLSETEAQLSKDKPCNGMKTEIKDWRNRKPGFYWVLHNARETWEVGYWNPHFFWQLVDTRTHFKDGDFQQIGMRADKPDGIEPETDFSEWQNREIKKYAFPGRINGLVGDQESEIPTQGLTKREMFAMAAMQGILANRELQRCLLKDAEYDGTTSENCYAVFAVKQADELLKHLES
jgi:hypothetical protein